MVTGSFAITMVFLAVVGLILHVIVIAYGVAYGLSIYDRRKRRERDLKKYYEAQKNRQESYSKEHPSRGRFYDGGVKYGDR